MVKDSEIQHKRRDVKHVLNAVLRSKQFADSIQLSDFLRYIVTKTLDGEQDDIKAYTIAVDALGRPEDFDPQTNAAVRVAAGRLRQALSLYNAEEAPADALLRIVLEPGSYIPSFKTAGGGSDFDQADHVDQAKVQEQQKSLVLGVGKLDQSENQNGSGEELSNQNSAALTSKSDVVSGSFSISRNFAIVCGMLLLGVVLAVTGGYFYFVQPNISKPDVAQQELPATVAEVQPLNAIDINRRPTILVTFIAPDTPYPDWFNIGEVIDSIGVSITRFDDYQFLGIRRTTALPYDTGKETDYHIRVTAYKREEVVRIFAQLTNEKEKRVIWSDQWPFERPQDLSNRVIPDLTGRAFSTLGSPYGVIYSDLVRTGAQRNELDCVVAAYKYFYAKTNAKHLTARTCAENLISLGSSLPTVHAALTFLYLDEYREGRNRRKSDPLDAAQKMATRAVSVGPASARAHQALFAVYKVKGFRDRARKSAEKAISLNPYDTDIIADYAAWLISTGDNQRGRELMMRVEQLLSARPAWIEFYRFLGAELAGEFEEANEIASLLDATRSPLVAAAVAIGAHRRGDQASARTALDELLRTSPGFASDPMAELVRRGFDEDVASKLVAKLVGSGLQVISPIAN